jgi:hypothetical protein
LISKTKKSPEEIGLKSRYPDFYTRVSTLDDFLVNNKRELAARNIDNYERSTRLRIEGLNFLNSTDT